MGTKIRRTTDGTTTAEFTFFTNAGQKITGNSCSHLMEKYKATNNSQLPVEITNTIGEKHIFQIQFGESTKKGAGRFIVNDILDIQPAANAQITGDKLAAASALTLDQPGKKDEVPDTQIATSSSPTIKESGSKNNDMPGTPPTDVIETVAETIASTIPHRPFEPHPTRKDSSAARTPKEPKAPTAKRSLNRDLSLEAKKKKEH
ncbi:nucleic acid-binding, OB-fold protein [Tanacetum coccineum]|uniref:Nucleic acid-binding, OB-fold protein n=1 Tax=Tanacetum coccineum TaxID=301880 RepID=A0ABQ5CCT8_9ASTR